MTATEEQPTARDSTPVRLLDAAIALASPAVAVATVTVRVAAAAGRPVVAVVLRPPLVPRPLQPGTVLDRVAEQGRPRRLLLADRLSTTIDRVVPAAADGVVRRVDLEALVRRVDLAGVAQEVVVSMDLPGLIRESTATVSSESARLVRMRGIAGDAAVGRMTARLRGRRPGSVEVGASLVPPVATDTE